MRRLRAAFRMAGIDLVRLASVPAGLMAFMRDLRQFKKISAESQSNLPFGRLYPCLEDVNAESGSAAGHYFHQDLHVARRIFAASPRRHVDVASRVDGFVAHVAVYREIEVFDIRKLSTTASNIIFRQYDIMQPLPIEFINAFDSLSCLHALEHFGLGRYGDPLDPDGHIKGLLHLQQALEPNGTLYLSMPMGPDRIEFNAHRVFSTQSLLRLIENSFELRRFSFVDDNGDFFDDVDPTGSEAVDSFGCKWGLGILEATKKG